MVSTTICTVFAIFIYWSCVTKVKPLMDTFEFTTVSLNGVFLVAVGILILFTLVELNLMYTCLFTL